MKADADIVDRLRTWVHATDALPASDIMDEASVEIARLRAICESLRVEVRTQRQEIAALRAEQRLITDLDRPNPDAAAGWIP